MRSPCCLCVPPNIFFAAGTCVTSRCLAMAVPYGSTIAAFRRHVTLRSNVVERSVFCDVRVASNTQYVAKESSQSISSSQNLYFGVSDFNLRSRCRSGCSSGTSLLQYKVDRCVVRWHRCWNVYFLC
jgi:hypothetical protein